MSTAGYIAATFAEVVVLVVVLLGALTLVAQRLEGIAAGLATLTTTLADAERDVVALDTRVPAVNGTLGAIVGALPGIAQNAETLARS